MVNSAALRWVGYRLGLVAPDTQTTAEERACLARHASGRRALVEIGVMHGATTALLRSVMAEDGRVTGLDPHPNGRLGVSFERLTALQEVAKHRRGHVTLVRKRSDEAAPDWSSSIDFLFIDGDHSWSGIERDWTDWTPHVTVGGIVALHDSRSVPGRADLDSVRFTANVVMRDHRFVLVDSVHTLTVLKRVA